MRLRDLKKYSLTDEDLRSLLGSSISIVTYPELKNVSNIRQILDDKGRAMILFLTENENTGHWQCIMDHGPYIEWQDSYGIQPDGTRRWLNKREQENLGQDQDLLKPLLKAAGKPVIQNKYRFQRGDDVNTCGRHCAARLLFKDLSLDQYKNLMDLMDMDPDDFVTAMTYEGISK